MDIIERAEALPNRQFLPEVFRPTWDELIAALKAERAENERLRSTWTPPEDDYQAVTRPRHNSAAKNCVQHPPKTPGTGVCSICSTYDNATWLTQREMIYGDD